MSKDFDIYFPDAMNNKRPAVWQDHAGITHRAVGSYMHERIRLMWTACQEKDIPGNKAWLQNKGDFVTCEGCKQAEAIFDEDEQEERRNNGQFGVGA